MSGINYDCYVHYYIRQQKTQSLWRHSCLYLLWRQNNGGLFTSHSGRVYDKTALSVNSRGRGLGKATSLWPESVNGLRKLWAFKMFFFFYHYSVVMYTQCQHTFKFKHHVKKVTFKVRMNGKSPNLFSKRMLLILLWTIIYFCIFWPS